MIFGELVCRLCRATCIYLFFLLHVLHFCNGAQLLQQRQKILLKEEDDGGKNGAKRAEGACYERQTPGEIFCYRSLHCLSSSAERALTTPSCHEANINSVWVHWCKTLWIFYILPDFFFVAFFLLNLFLKLFVCFPCLMSDVCMEFY